MTRPLTLVLPNSGGCAPPGGLGEISYVVDRDLGCAAVGEYALLFPAQISIGNDDEALVPKEQPGDVGTLVRFRLPFYSDAGQLASRNSVPYDDLRSSGLHMESARMNVMSGKYDKWKEPDKSWKHQ